MNWNQISDLKLGLYEEVSLSIENKDSFCILPFIHLATKPDGKVKTCCNASNHSLGNFNNDDMESLWNSDDMKGIRLKMLSGMWSSNCHKCRTQEMVGHRSKRITENQSWAKEYGAEFTDIISKVKSDGSMPFKIKYFDLRLGAKCNLKCVMCDPGNSTLWRKDHKAIYPQMRRHQLTRYYKWFNDSKEDHNWYERPIIQEQIYRQLKNITYLYFAGGEPLIMDQHYDILERCIERGYAKNIILRYNSNVTTWKDNLFKQWEKFKSVHLFCSIDDIKERNDYIRYPSKWEKVEKKFSTLDNDTPDNVRISIACTVQALNIYYIPELIKYFFSNKFKKIETPQFHLLYYPPHLNPKILPMDFKKKLRKRYTNFLSTLDRGKNEYIFTRIESILRLVESENLSHRLLDLKEYVELLDKQRKTSFSTSFPELQEIFLKKEEYTQR